MKSIQGDHKMRKMKIVVIIAMILFILFAILGAIIPDVSRDGYVMTNITLIIVVLAFYLLLMLCLFSGGYRDKQTTGIFSLMVICAFISAFCL